MNIDSSYILTFFQIVTKKKYGYKILTNDVAYEDEEVERVGDEEHVAEQNKLNEDEEENCGKYAANVKII